MTDPSFTFNSYREYVALCLKANEPIVTISEFAGKGAFHFPEEVTE